ncbi:VOC family protein [Mucilaginibacter ximonensis]|uniref:VOC family protein n=1 Tax=Mucilaginibacter ximonensis TaxID=538021 RepID=A0ABW5Y9C0_9SPHI
MKIKKALIVTALLGSFMLGYGFHSLTKSEQLGPRATGIGGIFFKCKDPKALKQWYADNLHMQVVATGATFAWREDADSKKKGITLWTPFRETTTYFAPSDKQFMINYRVVGLNALLANMKAKGISPVDSVEKTSYGDFVHVMDPEGNKIELWESK